MPVQFEELIELWSRPLESVSRGVEAFAKFYSDPVRVNGASMSLEALVQRALATQQAFSELGATVLARVDTPDTTTVVFREVWMVADELSALIQLGAIAVR